MPSAGIAIFRNELFSEPLPFGIISISSVSGASLKSMWITGTSMPHEVCSFLRVSGCTTELRSGYSRVARSQPRRSACFERVAVDLDAAADPDVVDRHAGVLAEQVVGLLGDADVGHHGREHRRAVRAGFGLLQPAEAALMSGGSIFRARM